jgi:hypothetical protein
MGASSGDALNKGKKGPSPSPQEATNNDSWIMVRPDLPQRYPSACSNGVMPQDFPCHYICIAGTLGLLGSRGLGRAPCQPPLVSALSEASMHASSRGLLVTFGRRLGS